jgi:hypothetical protein
VTLKVVPKAACDSEMFLKAGLSKSTNDSEGKPEQKFLMRLSEQSLELTTVFKEANRNLIFIFLFHKAV